MPYLKIQTNQHLDPESRQRVLSRASTSVAESLSKSERYVMVALETDRPMRFAGTDRPCAYLELKSIGLPVNQTETLSKSLTALMEELLAVSPERVYIEFNDARAELWGWNGSTFRGQ